MAANEATPDGTTRPAGGFSAAVEAGVLQSALETVSVLVDEARVHVDEDGWRATAIDPATVGMVDLSIPADAFESYEAEGETIGLDLARFQDVVGMVDADERVRLALDPATRTLDLRVGGLAYTLALIDPGAIRAEPDLPDDLDVAASVVLDAHDLDRATRAADLVADHVTLGADPDAGSILVSAEGDTDDVTVEMNDEDLDGRVTTDAEATYSLAYLADMTGVLPAESRVDAEFGADLPVTLRAELPDEVVVTYVLAPRIAR